ncbi:MAG TPA: hypothetical protein VF796_23195, partial [Humisphaera sp.]
DGRSLEGYATAAFREDGAALAVKLADRVAIVGLVAGRVALEVYLPAGVEVGPEVNWLSFRHLLLGSGYLVDLQSRMIVCEYVMPGTSTVRVRGGRAWYATDEVLRSAVLPHPDMAAAPAMAPPETPAVFAPGRQVAVEVGTDAPEALRERIRRGLQDQVRAFGMVLADDAKVRIVVSTQPGESRSFRVRGGGEVSFNGLVHKVAVTMNGDEAWSLTENARLPLTLFVNDGQSVDEAARKYLARSYDWFTGVRLPKSLVAPPRYTVDNRLLVLDDGTVTPYRPRRQAR